MQTLVRPLIQRVVGNCMIRWEKESIFSHITCIRPEKKEHDGLVIKALLPWEMRNLAVEERKKFAETFNSLSWLFRKKLENFGVPLSREYELAIVDGFALQISTYEGLNLAELLANETSELNVSKVVESVLCAIAGILEQPYPPEVGIDAKLENFAQSPVHGQPVFIDTFPPLVYDGNNYWVHYPNAETQQGIQTEIERKFLPEGILRRLRFSLLMMNTKWDDILLANIKEAIGGSIGENVCKFLSDLPDRIITEKPDKAELIIRNLQKGKDADVMREIALKVIPNDEKRAERLYRISRLSSSFSSPGYPPSLDQRWEEGKNLLLQFV